ncbi:MAG: ribosome assembly factor SBDS [Thermoplasmata archaeon]|nr:ribosome assembly factor SBDS [Thermoplasmata archaeon]
MPWDLRTSRKDEITKDMVIARLDRGGERFEILVRPEAVEALRTGEDINLVDELASDAIFRDVKKGLRASEEKMVEVFGTADSLEVATVIVREGDIALTTEQRRALREAKRKRLVAYIAANAINPQTGTPHPPQRIENAMEEAGVHVDPFRSVEEQTGPTLEALRPLLPISIEKTKFAIKLLPADAGPAYGEVRSFGTVLQEEWQPDGSWIGVVEVAAGSQGDFLDRLNERTHGNVETKILK